MESEPSKRIKRTCDTIAKITKATGIEKAVKFIAGEDCGCDERKEVLNKLFPYNRPNCLTETEHITLSEFFKRNQTQVSKSDQLTLLKSVTEFLTKGKSRQVVAAAFALWLID